MNIQQLKLLVTNAGNRRELDEAENACHAHWQMVFGVQSLVLRHLTDAERGEKYFGLAGMNQYAGHSYVACEAIVTILGDEYDIEILKIFWIGEEHFVLLFPDGTVLDPTNQYAEQSDFPVDMKQTAERVTFQYPCKRTKAVVKRIAFRVLKGL